MSREVSVMRTAIFVSHTNRRRSAEYDRVEEADKWVPEFYDITKKEEERKGGLGEY